MAPSDFELIANRVVGRLGDTHDVESAVRPSAFYNEGWLTALTLSVAASGVRILPFNIASNARWWTEALLRSPFNPRRRGDRRGEGLTCADAVIGHFNRRPKTKRGVRVRPDAAQWVVVEAKLGSRLSARTDNAEGFDQAARSVACLACELGLERVDPARCSSLGFFVFAPDKSLVAHRDLVSRERIAAKVKARVERFDDPLREPLERWFDGPFTKVLERAALDCVEWESIIEGAARADETQGRMLKAFYSECLKQM